MGLSVLWGDVSSGGKGTLRVLRKVFTQRTGSFHQFSNWFRWTSTYPLNIKSVFWAAATEATTSSCSSSCSSSCYGLWYSCCDSHPLLSSFLSPFLLLLPSPVLKRTLGNGSPPLGPWRGWNSPVLQSLWAHFESQFFLQQILYPLQLWVIFRHGIKPWAFGVGVLTPRP